MQDMKQILQFLAAAAAFSILMSGYYLYQHPTIKENVIVTGQPGSGNGDSGAGTSN